MEKFIPREIFGENKDRAEAVSLHTKEELVNFYFTYGKFQTDPKDFEPSLEEWAKSMAESMVGQDGNLVADHKFFGGYDGDKMVATSELQLIGREDGGKYGYLCHLTVDSESRNAGLAKKMIGMGIEAAKQESCDFISCLVNTRNMTSLMSGRNGGFFVGGVVVYDDVDKHWSEFKIFKLLDRNFDDLVAEGSEEIEVPLYDLKLIQDKIAEGYIGVALKPVEKAGVELEESVYEIGDVRGFVMKLVKVKNLDLKLETPAL